MGLSRSAAVGIVERIIGFCMLVPIAYLSALSAFTAQNVGAGQEERAKKGLFTAVFMCIPVTLLFFALVQIWPEWVAGLFTSDSDVILNSAQYLRTYAFDIIMVTFVFCFNGFFAGYGHTGFTMANGLISTFAVRVPVVVLMSLVPGATLTLIGIAAPAASAVQICMQVVYYAMGKWKKNAVLN
jgi:Na+-driven multidrug efflux pump